MPLPPFRYLHIVPLFIATASTFGGTWPIFDPTGALRTFGFPNHIALSKPAGSPFVIQGARISAIGMAIYAFYFQGNLAAVDTVLTAFSYLAVVDAYALQKEGATGHAVFRLVLQSAVGVFGYLGLTASA